MARFARRDPAALEELFSRFGSTVYSIGLRWFGDERSAAAFTERAFVDLWHRASAYRWSPVPLETWVAWQALGAAVRMAAERHADATTQRKGKIDDAQPVVA